MSKFCGKCGTQLNENGLCPKCDAVQIERMKEPKQTYAASNSSDVQPPAKKKKSGKKAVKVIAVVLAVVIVLGAATGALTYFNVIDIPIISSVLSKLSPNKTDNNFIFEHNGNKYYIGGDCVVKLNDDGSATAVTVLNSEIDNSESSEKKEAFKISLQQSVYDGNAIYAPGNQNLCKYVFIDDVTVESSVLISENGFKNDPGSISYTCNWQLDEKYIYFVTDTLHLGRIDLDKNKIKFNDETVSPTYTVSDGCIYYYDNGFSYNNNSSAGVIDSDRVGIYKMKFDGSGKEQLLKCPYEISENNYDSQYSDLTKYGEYLYFIDNTTDGNHRVCKMKTDGSDFEYVSENSARCYTVNVDEDALYYAAYSTYPDVIKKTSDKEEVIFSSSSQYNSLALYNNFLYFKNEGSDRIDIRYNLESGSKEKLKVYYKKEKTDDNGYTIYEERGPYANWEKVGE